MVYGKNGSGLLVQCARCRNESSYWWLWTTCMTTAAPSTRESLGWRRRHKGPPCCIGLSLDLAIKTNEGKKGALWLWACGDSKTQCHDVWQVIEGRSKCCRGHPWTQTTFSVVTPGFSSPVSAVSSAVDWLRFTLASRGSGGSCAAGVIQPECGRHIVHLNEMVDITGTNSRRMRMASVGGVFSSRCAVHRVCSPTDVVFEGSAQEKHHPVLPAHFEIAQCNDSEVLRRPATRRFRRGARLQAHEASPTAVVLQSVLDALEFDDS